MKELVSIQTELKAPKGQFNKFGGYKYRSCEDILEALKEHLKKNTCTLIITDEPVIIGEWHFIKATAILTNSAGESVSTTAFAREEESKKGMDASQITGTASSYARKYALNGLFCIDDTKDADATNDHGKDAPAQAAVQTTPKQTPAVAPAPQPQAPAPTTVQVQVSAEDLQSAITAVANAKTKEELNAIWQKYKAQYGKTPEFVGAIKAAPANPKNASK